MGNGKDQSKASLSAAVMLTGENVNWFLGQWLLTALNKFSS